MSSRVTLRGSQRHHSSKSIRVGRPHPAERIEVTVLLRRRESAPHPWAFQRYHTHEELAAFYGAFPEDIEAVETVASQRHLSVLHVDQAARTVTIGGAFADVASMFGADVEVHRIGSRTFRSRRGHLYVPAELAGRVIGVLGFDTRPAMASRRAPAPAMNAQASYTPPEVAALYNFPKNADGSGETIAVIELGGGFRAGDLDQYWQKLGLDPVAVAAIAVGHGSNKPDGSLDGDDGEVVLDIEVAGAVAPKAKLAVYFAPNTDQGFLKAIHAAIHDRVRKPSVISISWGGAEADWPRQHLDLFNQAFHDAALLGITVFCAAGDDGSTDGVSDGKPHVDFPASSPWVVACGGTTLIGAQGKITSETVWNNGTNNGATGGGVSTFFPLPDYQAQAGVPISTVRPKFAGRGVPDVAGCADPRTGYRIAGDGAEQVIGGTSAVAPLWAGLTALLNQQLGTRVGFINPLFYGTLAHGGGLNDVVSGTNGDFASQPGWDACTGMGTPNGALILEQLQQIQAQQSKRDEPKAA